MTNPPTFSELIFGPDTDAEPKPERDPWAGIFAPEDEVTARRNRKRRPDNWTPRPPDGGEPVPVPRVA